MDMFSQNEIILMIGVISVLLIFILVLTILDIREYKKNKDEELVVEDNNDLQIESEPIKKVEIEEIDATPNEDIFIEDIEEVSVSNKEELNNTIVMPKVEVESIKPVEIVNNENIEKETNNNLTRIDINEELRKLEETMVDEDNLTQTITNFEEEQERTAIISLDELMKNTDKLYSANEMVQYDDGNEPISIDEVMNMYNSHEEAVENAYIEEEKEEKDIYTHKESIPFISSIYGMSDSFENTANYEKFNRAKANEFMNKLKEMAEGKEN